LHLEWKLFSVLLICLKKQLAFLYDYQRVQWKIKTHWYSRALISI
jgi:hypothetical protein